MMKASVIKYICPKDCFGYTVPTLTIIVKTSAENF